MSKNPENIAIINNEAEERFQAEVEGRLAFLQYDKSGGPMVLTHTEVPPELEGRGLGSKLVEAALEHARSARVKIVPQCPFVASYIKDHQEYESLVVSE
jgi:predicted GNAT family acetyltransferase